MAQPSAMPDSLLELRGRTAFFYGTLMAPPVLHRVIYGSTTPHAWQLSLTQTRPAILPGYRRHKVRFADYPAIQAHSEPHSSVRGSLVTGLLDEDIRRLDIFEGEQYCRRTVRVKVLREAVTVEKTLDEESLGEFVAGEVEVETYVWKEELGRGLEEEEWDFEEFRREKMWAWVGEASSGGGGDGGVVIDEGFADVDRDVAGREGGKHDPTGGRGMNGHITRELEAEVGKKGVEAAV